MNDQNVKVDEKVREARRERNAELERRVKAEGLDLEHPQGRERFEELLRRAAKPKE